MVRIGQESVTAAGNTYVLSSTVTPRPTLFLGGLVTRPYMSKLSQCVPDESAWCEPASVFSFSFLV